MGRIGLEDKSCLQVSNVLGYSWSFEIVVVGISIYLKYILIVFSRKEINVVVDICSNLDSEYTTSKVYLTCLF